MNPDNGAYTGLDYALKFSEKKDEYDNSWSLWVQPRIRKDAARLILRFRLDKIYCENMQVDAINRELNAINREIFMRKVFLWSLENSPSVFWQKKAVKSED